MQKFVLFAAAVLPAAAQTFSFSTGDVAFQALGNPVLQGVRVLDEGFGNRVIKGKPFSATEERHSLQVLGDGTRIENTQTNRLFRDADGRTRVEEMNGTVTIYDPADGSRVQLDPATKTAHRNGALVGVLRSGPGLNLFTGGVFSGYANGVTAGPFISSAANTQGVMSETTENLGNQNVNGVNATGVRTTMVIPKGQIGNNKDIKVMTERWSSSDLQMLVKSVNSDPRFGDTTYQLSKITQGAPDAALFQVPADYTVTEQPEPRLSLGKAARGVAAAPGPVRPKGSVVAPAPAKP